MKMLFLTAVTLLSALLSASDAIWGQLPANTDFLCRINASDLQTSGFFRSLPQVLASALPSQRYKVGSANVPALYFFGTADKMGGVLVTLHDITEQHIAGLLRRSSQLRTGKLPDGRTVYSVSPPEQGVDFSGSYSFVFLTPQLLLAAPENQLARLLNCGKMSGETVGKWQSRLNVPSAVAVWYYAPLRKKPGKKRKNNMFTAVRRFDTLSGSVFLRGAARDTLHAVTRVECADQKEATQFLNSLNMYLLMGQGMFFGEAPELGEELMRAIRLTNNNNRIDGTLTLTPRQLTALGGHLAKLFAGRMTDGGADDDGADI